MHTFHSGWHNSRGDHSGFEQPQIVGGKIKELAESGNLGNGSKVGTDQTDTGRVDHPEEYLGDPEEP
jgi:hypothetical protein